MEHERRSSNSPVHFPLYFPAFLSKKEITTVYQTKAQSATQDTLKPFQNNVLPFLKYYMLRLQTFLRP